MSLAQGERVVQPSVCGSGEPRTDRGAGVCPVVGAFMCVWNDGLPQEDRMAILAPLIPSIDGSRNAGLEARRGLLIGDWLVRTQAVAWLRLAQADAAADALEGGPGVTDVAATTLFAPLEAARWAAVDVRDAAWSTPAGAATSEERAEHLGMTWDAPWSMAADAWSNAGLDEARAATAAAALDAGRAAVWAVASLRVHAEVWNLAHETARTAAHAGYCLGGPGQMRATRKALQRSAAELVVAMIEAR